MKRLLKVIKAMVPFAQGGRYDQLIALYTDMQIPGVGISIGVTRLFFVLKEIVFLEDYILLDDKDYLIIPLGNTLKECIEVNQVLQKQGVKSGIYLKQDPLKKQFKYASAKGIDWVIIIGEDEVENGQLVVKNMKTGDQIKVPRGEWLR